MAARQEDMNQPFLFAPNEEDRIRKAFIDMLPVGREAQEGPKKPDVKLIRRVEPRDYLTILSWFTDAETQNHLSPLPKLPENWNDKNKLAEAFLDIGNYYDNRGEPKKITPLVAVNEDEELLGVVTIRWKGDPWAPERVPSIERLLVDPILRGDGVGTALVEHALEEIFKKKEYEEARAWVMSDEQAPGWGRIVEFFSKFGFSELLHSDRSWAKYQERRQMPADGRDAKWLKITRESWEEYKKKKKQGQIVAQEPLRVNGSSVQ